jgi:hypothetical protein
MATNVNFRVVAAVVVFTTLLGIYTAKLWPRDESGTNFCMYYTPACLVRSHQSMHIYDVVDRNRNPQMLFADPNTVWAKTALAHGITRITLYLYPPTLADLIVPLTALRPSAALMVWHALEVLMMLALSVALTQMLDIKIWGSSILVAATILLFRPTLHTLHWGQVSILLTFLLTIGFALYVSGYKGIAALLFVLAIAIKLEPIVVVVPLIAWRDWKGIRSMAIWGGLVGLGLWAVNGTQALSLYFLHQLPAMSGGDVRGATSDVNRSLANIFITYLGEPHAIVSPHGIAWLGRVASALILCSAGWLSRLQPDEDSTPRRQFEIGLMFLLFACCLSPYSWFYNWALCAPVMIMFCQRVWEGKADFVETFLLTTILLSLTTSKFNMALVTPVLAIALGIVGLYRMRLEQRPAEGNYQINQLKPVTAS